MHLGSCLRKPGFLKKCCAIPWSSSAPSCWKRRSCSRSGPTPGFRLRSAFRQLGRSTAQRAIDLCGTDNRWLGKLRFWHYRRLTPPLPEKTRAAAGAALSRSEDVGIRETVGGTFGQSVFQVRCRLADQFLDIVAEHRRPVPGADESVIAAVHRVQHVQPPRMP